MGVLDHECCHIISFISWPMMIDIDAEVHVIILTFLKEQTFNWFFFNHKGALNEYVSICASLTFCGTGEWKGKVILFPDV